MFKGSNRQLEAFKVLPVMAISSGARVHKPTAEQISKMMESLDRDGQQVPIVVRSTGHQQYEIVSGATRHEAAVKLGWIYIQAKIMRAEHHIDYKIAELVENEFRSDLTKTQHAEMQAKLKELRAEREKLIEEELAEIKGQPKAKGGRGKKGGVRDAARKAGVSRQNARTMAKKTGLAAQGNPVSKGGDACDYDWSNVQEGDFGNPSRARAQSEHYRREATHLAEAYPLRSDKVDLKFITEKEIQAVREVARAWSDLAEDMTRRKAKETLCA